MLDPIHPTQGQPVRLGDYLITRQIGEGGMARVYAGEELMSHRPVAVKVLRTELAESEPVRKQFLTEMGILANLDHPNIVRCLLCTSIEGRPIMVLELLEGWTLREMLTERVALPWIEVVRYAVQIGKALHAAHGRTPPIVHRDLKPENVMILPNGQVKVMDFGIAKILEAATGTTSHAIGTLQYMSPEHIDARPIDGRADLFALGLLMWEMLAGRQPFTGSSPRALLDAICTAPTPGLPEQARLGLPPHVEALVFRMLEKDPDARPANASEVVALLEPWTKSVVVHSPSASASSRPAPTPAPAPPHRPAPAPRHDTIDIVESAKKGKIEEHVDAIADEVGRFAQATSNLIFRVSMGLIALPAAALVFLGVPFLVASIDVALLDDDGVDLENVDEPSWFTPEFGIGFALVIVVVFVRACWAHHRPRSRSSITTPWWSLGLLVNAGWILTTVIELAPGNRLNPDLHAFFLIVGAIWLTITMSWAIGRMTSGLFRRLERTRVS
ncbi:serine/threonine-protein kinase [Nannocystaceae bacterium ST9]